jgi:hypothetical protein
MHGIPPQTRGLSKQKPPLCGRASCVCASHGASSYFRCQLLCDGTHQAFKMPSTASQVLSMLLPCACPSRGMKFTWALVLRSAASALSFTFPNHPRARCELLPANHRDLFRIGAPRWLLRMKPDLDTLSVSSHGPLHLSEDRRNLGTYHPCVCTYKSYQIGAEGKLVHPPFLDISWPITKNVSRRRWLLPNERRCEQVCTPSLWRLPTSPFASRIVLRLSAACV